MKKSIIKILLFSNALFINFELLLGQSPIQNPDTNFEGIIGGDLIEITDAPYQVNINGYCGGVILSNRWILTATHCLSSNTIIEEVFIQAGSKIKDNSSGQIIYASNIIFHPNFNYNNLNNDLALIYLSEPLLFNEFVAPVEFANPCNINQFNISPGQFANISGWGSTGPSQTSSTSDYLKALDISILSNSSAFQINFNYNPSFNRPITDKMIAFYNNNNTGAGPGDSGGPAVITKNGRKILIGICSWSEYPKGVLPSIYTNVFEYSSWIKQVTGLNSNNGVDLYMKDATWDIGLEPNKSGDLWGSDDLWVRKNNDGGTTHQEPVFNNSNNGLNYVYITVRNRGCITSNGNDKVKLFWAKSSTALSWPDYWNGAVNINNIPLGGNIGEITIPQINPGEKITLTLPWNVPSPISFSSIINNELFSSNDLWNFSILAKIESVDPIIESSNFPFFVGRNNNVVTRNTSTIYLGSGGLPYIDNNVTGYSTNIAIFNPDYELKKFDLKFNCKKLENDVSLFSLAETRVTVGNKLWDAWVRSGMNSKSIKVIDPSKKEILLIDDNATLNDIEIEGNKLDMIKIDFNFLTKKIETDYVFDFFVQQVESGSDSLIGGKKIHLNSSFEDLFFADAGGDKEIKKGEVIEINPSVISQQAKYNWYNQDGDLIYSGVDFIPSSEVSAKYKLEVVSLIDGLKDYDSIEIKVKSCYIEDLSPNPASNYLELKYIGDNSVLVAAISPIFAGGVSNLYQLDNSSNTKIIDISSFETGYYMLVLLNAGNVVDTSYFYKN